MLLCFCFCFFFQAEDGIRDLVRSRGLGDVYKRQALALLMALAATAQSIEIFSLYSNIDSADITLVGLSLIHI